MSEHTKEPWHVGEHETLHGMVYAQDGYSVADCNSRHLKHGGRATNEENARRVVACVNALEGIPTELIEQGGFAAVPIATHREVKQQRDGLLAALKRIVDSLSEHDDEGMIEHTQQMIAARAAIARVEVSKP